MNESNSDFSTVDLSDNQDKNQQDNDDDIILLCELKTYTDPKKRTNYYYDHDSVVDNEHVLKRWNKKKLSDPNVNLTVSHYRQRLFGEPALTESIYKYKPGIFLDLDNNDEQTHSTG